MPSHSVRRHQGLFRFADVCERAAVEAHLRRAVGWRETGDHAVPEDVLVRGLRQCSPIATARRGWSTRKRRAADGLKIATYNVNGVNGRLPRLLEWLAEISPDVVCCRRSRPSTNAFLTRRSSARATARSFTVSDRTMASRSWRRAAFHARSAAAFPATTKDRQSRYLEVSRRRQSSRRSTCPTAIPAGTESSTTSSRGSSG
jgi:hypothetical protein